MPRPRVPVPVRLFFWRARPLVLIAGLFVAGCAIARQAAPPAPATQNVVVAARDLSPGHPLTSDDLRVVRLPCDLVPTGAGADPTALRDREVTVTVPEGLPLVDGVLDGDRFGLDTPPGTVAVPIRLADPAVAALLRPGDRIDLVAPAPEAITDTGDNAPSTVVLAQAALVLDVIAGDQEDGDDSLLDDWSATGVATEPLTVVAVGPEEGHRLAASDWGSLGAVLVGGS